MTFDEHIWLNRTAQPTSLHRTQWAIFVDTQFHGIGAGRALIDKARCLHSILELKAFREITIGRKFYDSYGFELLDGTTHAQTGKLVIRLVLYSKGQL